MIQKSVLQNTQEWDSWVTEQAGNGSFTQTSTWAELNQLVNQAKPVTMQIDGLGGPKIRCLFGLFAKTKSLYSHGGPVLSKEARVEDVERFLTEVKQFCKTNSIENIIFYSLPTLREWPEGALTIFSEFGFSQKNWSTAVVDLQQSEESLFEGLDYAAKKAIRKCERSNIRVFECQTFEDYYQHYLTPYIQATQNPKPFVRDILEKSWQIDQNRFYRYWIAYDEQNQPLGFLGSYRFNGLVTEIMSGITLKAREDKLPVQDILHWHLIKTHKELGDRFYDVAGFNPEPSNVKEIGIKRFKEKWGGKRYEIPTLIGNNAPWYKKMVRRLKKALHV